MSRLFKSKIAPTAFVEKQNYMIVGDKFTRILSVISLPAEFSLGLLAMYVNMPNVKMSVTTTPLELSIAKMLRKDYRNLNAKYLQSKDVVERSSLQKQIGELDDYIREVVRKDDKTHNIYIQFTITADDLDQLQRLTNDLKSRLMNDSFEVKTLSFIQQGLFKYASPIFVEDGLNENLKYNLGVPLPSTGVAGLYPYIFDTLKDDQGFLFGSEYINGGAIVFDQFYYLNNKPESVAENRLTGNMVIVGSTGSGKTTAIKLLIRDYIKKHIKIIWIDPENKNFAMTKKYGGSFVNWGSEDAAINVFDLKPVSTEEDEGDDKKYNTEIAIYNVVDDIKIILSCLYPKINEDTLTIVGDSVVKTYEAVGISFETDFRRLSSIDYPIFSDLAKVIDDEIMLLEENGSNRKLDLYYDLRTKLNPILNEYRIYFNKHTTIQVDGTNDNIISFGTKILYNKTEQLQNALNHIMMQYAWTLCLDESQKSAFIYDEAHMAILKGKTSEDIATFQRRSRKYKNVMVLGTQEPKDFADERVLTNGKAIFNNATYHLLMKLRKDGINDLRKLITLNEMELQYIESFTQGQAILTCGYRKIPMNIFATESELAEQ